MHMEDYRTIKIKAQTVSHSSLKQSLSGMKCVAVDPVYKLNNVLKHVKF